MTMHFCVCWSQNVSESSEHLSTQVFVRVNAVCSVFV